MLNGKIKLPNPFPYPSKLLGTHAGPEDILADLFERVQNQRTFADGKTIVDLVPARRLRKIKQEYELQSRDPNFDLPEFISRHFYEFSDEKSAYKTKLGQTPAEHIDELWDVLTRRTDKTHGSLIALPHPYVVPGGRFNEQFYWDSYFIMLGLAAAGRWEMIRGMVDNYAYMLRKFGHIPTANRTYFLSRSQPPYLSRMLQILAAHYGGAIYAHYLPVMIAEYRFWMRGENRLDDTVRAHRRVVRLPGGEILNRYFDANVTPRPESLREDINTAHASDDLPAKTFLDLRAAAESGWDFSSRWLDNPNDLSTIRTTDIIPVDLNCLLYDLEKLIGKTYRKLRQNNLADKFQAAAERRAAAIERYCWHHDDGFYYDYDFANFSQTYRKSLAAAHPLWSEIASPDHAEKVANRFESEFLKSGGLVTTLAETGQQWDAPNGWAPLQWVAIQGLRKNGFDELANQVKDRWLKTNIEVYNRTGKMVEKYNVADPAMLGGGGEYPLQDGFGWTNGVLRALLDD